MLVYIVPPLEVMNLQVIHQWRALDNHRRRCPLFTQQLFCQLPCWELRPPCQTYDICSCCSRIGHVTTSQLSLQQMSIIITSFIFLDFFWKSNGKWLSPWCSQVLWKTRFLKRRIPRNSANRGRSMLQWLHSRRRHGHRFSRLVSGGGLPIYQSIDRGW